MVNRANAIPFCCPELRAFAGLAEIDTFETLSQRGGKRLGRPTRCADFPRTSNVNAQLLVITGGPGSLTGARGINQMLQEALNPPGEHSIEKFGYRFSVDDKVMQIENNYDKDVYNGDIGFVTHIDPDEQELTATFDDHVVTYAFGELDELVLCYATTIHKSQGSEYPVVVIPVSTQHYMMLKRNLIYTGITRGKRLVVLVGQKRALAMAVKGKQTERRWSKLAEWLRL